MPAAEVILVNPTTYAAYCDALLEVNGYGRFKHLPNLRRLLLASLTTKTNRRS